MTHLSHLKHMALVRPGLDGGATGWALTEIDRLNAVFKRECDLTVELRAEVERLRAALRTFVGCAYPVATEISPRGRAWRPEESLDYALGEAKKALGDEQSAEGKTG